MVLLKRCLKYELLESVSYSLITLNTNKDEAIKA